MRILIDGDTCTGHGRCYSLVAELFESDDMGHSLALIEVVGDEHMAAARSAMLNCPEQAISLVDDPTPATKPTSDVNRPTATRDK